jgi:hypothetical protein
MTEHSSKILIVAGMHRSGTSVITQWLHRCNLNIGENLLGADIGNDEGHFEDIDFYRYHEDVLMDNHLSRFGYVKKPVSSLSPYQEEQLKFLTAFKSKMNAQWGWKEPRTCLFLDHYRRLLPHAYYLIVIRDFQSTVNSLIVRDFKHVEAKYLARKLFGRLIWKWFRRNKRKKKLYENLSTYYLNIWITYNEELLKHMELLQNQQFIAVDYKLLNQNDKRTFSVLKDDWKFAIEYVDFSKVFKEKLISKTVDISQFVVDKSLLETAYVLEDKLRAYV